MANIKNLAVGTILTPPSGTTGTNLVLNSGHGSRMPTTFPYYLLAYPTGVLPSFDNAEIIRVDASSADTLTIVRGQRTSSAKTMAAGWIVSNGIMTEDMFMSSLGQAETLAGTANGTNPTFTTAQPYTMLWLFKNGVFMSPGGVDYTYTGNTVTFVTAQIPSSGAKIVAIPVIGSQLMIAGSDNFITDDVPTGAIDNVNNSFTVSRGSYVAGTLEVFQNGLKLKRNVHFIETSPSNGGFNTTDALLTNDDLMARYQLAAVSTGNAQSLGNFTASQTPSANIIPVSNSSGVLPVGFLPFSKTIDANGWTVYNNGLWTEYTYTQSGTTASISAHAGLAIASLSLPVGMSNRTGVTSFIGYSTTAQEVTFMITNIPSSSTITIRAFNAFTGAITTTYEITVRLITK